MAALFKESLRQHIRLYRKYDHMRRVYREALPELSSQRKWETVLFDKAAINA
jgi:galactofuranosylgalactofuranosylrhamnosyl-N-acetylglucosaminyl-diphospho-decaprenol beta-1,5/1,6-galactofuranosyltransferase